MSCCQNGHDKIDFHAPALVLYILLYKLMLAKMRIYVCQFDQDRSELFQAKYFQANWSSKYEFERTMNFYKTKYYYKNFPFKK